MVSSDGIQEDEHLPSENHSETNGQLGISRKSNFVLQCMKHSMK